MALDVTERAAGLMNLVLRPGPRWSSLDQLRMFGSKRLTEELGVGQIGRVRVKNTEYVLMHAQTFDQVYGLAQEIHRLSQSLVLIRQAVQLAMRIKRDPEGMNMAIEHLRDIAFIVPELAAEPAPTRDLALTDGNPLEPQDQDVDDTFELDPTRIARPTFTAAPTG